MAEIVNINSINPVTFELQEYSTSDSSLITSFNIDTVFNPNIDYLEYFIYDLNGNILIQNVSGYPGYTLVDNNVVLDPEADLRAYGYDEGQYNTLYNFLSPKLSSNSFNPYFISEISTDRTEVRLDTTSIPNDLVISSSLELINDITNSTGSYYDFYLNFGNNDLVIAVNALLDTTDPNNPTVLIKLYEPLPPQFDINSQLWVVTQVSQPVAYNISINQIFDITSSNIQLRGPNTNVSIKNQINNSTDYSNYQSLSATTAKTGSNSLQYQLNNLLAQTGVTVNVDYADYANFIHFSNAQVRLENFYYKLQLIEQYSYSSSLSNNTTSNYYVSQSSVIYQNKIDTIITSFDNYEYYLYYNSGSTCWPKSNTAPPYVNVSTTSSAGLTWFASQSAVAELYDSENNNALTLAVPSYIRDDSNNDQYILFVEMVGQLFDEVFVYLQGITDKADNDNRLNYGVSKDLVADVLRDLGIKIYQNNFSSNDLYQALIGMTPSGSLFNLPFTTPTLPVPTGSGLEYITTYVTASSTSSLAPTYDVNASIYKRIYNSVPYILKKKGSYAGLRALINLFGVPDTVLRISEFGGQNKINTNDYDYWYNQFNYAFYTSGSNYVTSSFSLNTGWASANDVPQAVEFRFKTDGLPQNTASIASQSLWETDQNVKLVLKYTGSGYTSGSYTGSVVNPYYQYAKLDFIPNNAAPTISASIYLPFYDGGWWSVLVNKEGTNYTLTAKNKIYIGDDGNFIGFQASSSITSAATTWNSSTKSYFGISSSLSGKVFTGSLQEIRYYTNALSQSKFDDYVMNPYAIDGNYVNSAPYVLAFRAPLGSDLITGSTTSIHPKVTGSWATTSSFASNSSYYYNTTPAFENNTEVIFVNEFPAGIKNRISNKIQQQNIVLPYSSSDSNIPNADVLSPFRSIQQQSVLSGSYTKNINYVEIAFSPQNEINDDINEQLGYFNLGEYIGDPRLQSTTAESYPALDALRDAYFEKYSSNYQWFDYIRLIEFFDNSLFKMLQDFIPARSDLAAGIVVKQHVLERNKYPVPQVTLTASLANIGSGSTNIPYVVQDQTITASILVGTITGSNGGSMPNLFGQTQSFNYFVNITQSWSGNNLTPAGYVPYLHDSQDEFFNGELSGSVLTVTTGSLSDCQVTIQQVYIDSSYTNLSTDPYVINYDFDFNKTYYITFSLINLDSVGSGFILYNNGPGTIFQNAILTSNIGVGQTYTKNQYQLNGVLTPLTFANTFPLTDLEVGDIIVYEAYIEPDCEVISNDAQIERQSSKYVMVDFDNSFITASNEAAVLGGYATKAPVQDSNYTLARQINSRYVGKELVASNLNKWTEGDISYGKSVTVGNPETYFVYFNNVGSTSPEWGNNLSAKTQANVKLIINDSGSATKPINDAEGINLGIVQQSFGDNGNATLVLDDYDTFGINLNNLNGTWPVFKSGVSIAPIVYTQTASYNNNGDIIGFGYTGSINFVQGQQGPDVTKNDYQLLTYGVNYNLIQPSTLPYTLNFSTPVILGTSASFSTSTDAYNPTGSLSNLSGSGYVITLQAHIEASQIYAAIVDYAIQKNGVEVARIQLNHAASKTGDIYYTDANATTSSLYTVKAIAYRTLSGNAPTIQLNAASYFRVTQYPLPGTGVCNDFWYTGSGTPNILLASTSSTGLNNFIGQRQQNIDRSGFNPISLDFEPQLYDEIRFQGIENLAYSIINITSSNGQLKLELDGNIPSGTNLSYFLLRRYVNDPSNIILDLNKPAGASSGGVLKPEYVTDNINKNLDLIIQDLKSKGLI